MTAIERENTGLMEHVGVSQTGPLLPIPPHVKHSGKECRSVILSVLARSVDDWMAVQCKAERMRMRSEPRAGIGDGSSVVLCPVVMV